MRMVLDAVWLAAFFFAFMGGWLVSIGLAVAVALLDRRWSRRMLAGLLAVVSAAGGLTTFWVWGVGFDAADALKPVPAWVDPVMETGIVLANVGGFGVLVLLVLAVRRSTRLARQPAPVHT